MHRLPTSTIAGLLVLVLAGATAASAASVMQQPPIDSDDNPLLKEWDGPYGGLPPFSDVKVAHFEPALEAAMAERLEAVEEIARQSEAPTFENTIAALEQSGETLRRVWTVYNVWSSTMSDEAFQAVEREMSPRLAAMSDRITQNEELFRRIAEVYEDREALSPEQQRLTWLYYTDFARAGAKLDDRAKDRLSAINQRLATLYTKFSQNVLADENDHAVVLEREDELAGLPASVRQAAAAEAEERDMPGKWVIANTRSSVEPFPAYSDRRDLREKAWRMWVNRGDMGDDQDNNAIVSEILKLRSERAQLLGYPTHAHWKLEDSMAKTPERALELMEAVWTPAVDRVHEEVADMAAVARRSGNDADIQPWDYRYYAEKVRQEKYDLNESEVKEYLQLDELREGMFWVAGELFGFEFHPADEVSTYHPDVRVWEVTNRDTGEHVGLWYFDPYARTGKSSGAWMNAYRPQSHFKGEVTPIVSNNSNFVAGRAGEPVLISWSDAETLFHEFGHALHGLASDVQYPSLSGTSVVRDYVEFPSQLLEHWLSTPEVLQRFARHHETGEPIPQALVDRLEEASTFNQGFSTTEYLASALVDMKLHLLEDGEVDPDAFEREALEELGMPDEIVMRHRLPHFLHLFSSGSYAAAYYSYLWADVLTADAYGAFTEAGGPYDEQVARRLYKHVFSTGNTVDPAAAYRSFRGRAPEVEALMRKRGFATDPTSTE